MRYNGDTTYFPYVSPREEADSHPRVPSAGSNPVVRVHLTAQTYGSAWPAPRRDGDPLTSWQLLVVHVLSGAATLGLGLRYGSGAVLRLVAGLVAIFAPDKRSRARLALKVLRALSMESTKQKPSASCGLTKRYGRTPKT